MYKIIVIYILFIPLILNAQWGWGWTSGCYQGVNPTEFMVSYVEGEDSIEVTAAHFDPTLTAFVITYQRLTYPNRTQGTLLGVFGANDTTDFVSGKKFYHEKDGAIDYFSLSTASCKYSLEYKQDTTRIEIGVAKVTFFRDADSTAPYIYLEDIPTYSDTLQIYRTKGAGNDTVLTRGEGDSVSFVGSNAFVDLNNDGIYDDYTMVDQGASSPDKYYYYLWYRSLDTGLWNETAQKDSIPYDFAKLDTLSPDEPGFTATIVPSYFLSIENYVDPDSQDVQSVIIEGRTSINNQWRIITQFFNPQDSLFYIGNFFNYTGSDTFFIRMAAIDGSGNSSDYVDYMILPIPGKYNLHVIEDDTPWVKIDTIKIGMGSTNSKTALNYLYKILMDSSKFCIEDTAVFDIPDQIIDSYGLPCYLAIITFPGDTSDIYTWNGKEFTPPSGEGDSLIVEWHMESLNNDITQESPAGSVNRFWWNDSTPVTINAILSSSHNSDGIYGIKYNGSSKYTRFDLGSSKIDSIFSFKIDLYIEVWEPWRPLFQVLYDINNKIYGIMTDTDELQITWISGGTPINFVTTGLNIQTDYLYQGSSCLLIKWWAGAHDTTIFVGIGGNYDWDNTTLPAWPGRANTFYLGITGTADSCNYSIDNLRGFNVWLEGEETDDTPPDSADYFAAKGHELGIKDSVVVNSSGWYGGDHTKMKGIYKMGAQPANLSDGVTWLAEQNFDSTLIDTIGINIDAPKDTTYHIVLTTRDQYGNWQSVAQANKDTVRVDSTGEGGGGPADSVFYWACQSLGNITNESPPGYTELGDNTPDIYGQIQVVSDQHYISNYCIYVPSGWDYALFGMTENNTNIDSAGTLKFALRIGTLWEFRMIELTYDDNNEICVFIVNTDEIRVRYSAGGNDVLVTSSGINLTTGSWYIVTVKWSYYGGYVSLYLDINGTNFNNSGSVTRSSNAWNAKRYGTDLANSGTYYLGMIKLWDYWK